MHLSAFGCEPEQLDSSLVFWLLPAHVTKKLGGGGGGGGGGF